MIWGSIIYLHDISIYYKSSQTNNYIPKGGISNEKDQLEKDCSAHDGCGSSLLRLLSLD